MWGKRKPKRIVPSITISERDALLFERLINDGKQVVLSIDIDSTEHKEDTGNLDYYIMINDTLSYTLLSKVYNFRFDSYGLVNFRPVYAFSDQRSDFVTAANCFNNGHYCVHAEKNQPYKTHEYRGETLRQLCLWQETKGQSNTEKIWWSYVMEFAKLCAHKGGPSTLKSCSEKVMQHANVDAQLEDKINACYRSNDNEFSGIPIIDAQHKKRYDFEQYPGIVINDTVIRGYRSQKSIITSVCDSFIRRPAACMFYELKFNKYSYAKNTSFLHVHGLLVFSILIITVVLVIVKYYMTGNVHTDIEQGVRDHVHTYYRMNESDTRLKDTELRPAETTG